MKKKERKSKENGEKKRKKKIKVKKCFEKTIVQNNFFFGDKIFTLSSFL